MDADHLPRPLHNRVVSELQTIDAHGWTLAVHLHSPDRPRAAALLAHAMMADSAYLTKLADEMAAAGIATYRVDLRGHGASEPLPPDGDWTFDDLVEADLPCTAARIRDAHPDLPLWLVGHSLGGMAGIARQGRVPTFDGILAISSGLWGLEKSVLQRGIRRALLGMTVPLVRTVGRMPTRMLGIGPDEARSYWEQYTGWVRRGRWDALDGFDYLDAAHRIDIPCIGVRGTEDRLVRPADHRMLLCGPNVRFEEAPGSHFSVVRHAADKVISGILAPTEVHP